MPIDSNEGRDEDDAKKGKQFDFITAQDPSHFLDQTNRKKVRSHVSRLQHRQAHLDHLAASATRNNAGLPLKSRADDATTAPQQHSTREQYSQTGHSTVPVLESKSRTLETPVTSTSFHVSLAAASHRSRSRERVPLLPSARSLLLSASEANRIAYDSVLHDPNDHVGRALARVKLGIPTVMTHYAWIVSTQAADFVRQFTPNMTNSNFAAEMMLEYIFKEPASITAAALLATSHILSIRNAPVMTPAVAACIFELRGFIMQSINAAFEQSDRALAGPTILAVLLLASHEGLQGSHESYHIHMQGLVKMLNARGGLASLASEHPFFERFLVWQDANVATVVRTTPYVSLVENHSNIPAVKADPEMWLLEKNS